MAVLCLLFAALLADRWAEPVGPAWRNYEEVFDFAQSNGHVMAATNGGLLIGLETFWAPMGSPPAERQIVSFRPLAVKLADGRTLELQKDHWVASNVGVRARTLESGIIFAPGDPWPLQGAPPPVHVYCLCKVRTRILAGTNQGLYESYAPGTYWIKDALPSKLPVSRPNGVAQIGDVYVIGGIGGLFIGVPGDWKQVCADSIRQIVTRGEDVWVVHGNGAVDKVRPQEHYVWPDVLVGESKRPWTSCVNASASGLLFGGQGGWLERSAHETEHYPEILKGDIVQAIARQGEVRWVGSEKSGLVRFSGAGHKIWNPGNGLTDPNVTALIPIGSGAIVGTAHSGLFEVVGDNIHPLPGPTTRITALCRWDGALVMGGMDGCWVERAEGWAPLRTFGEETTSLSVLPSQLAVTTPTTTYFFASTQREFKKQMRPLR
jgi:hypothetical protein